MEKVFVKKSGIERRGVFATRSIKKGEVVIVWHPKKIISKNAIGKLPKDKQNHTTPAGNEKYIVMGTPEKFVNHFCNPNTFIKKRKDIALKNIKKGEEITSDYSVNGIDKWKMKCLCKNKNCRKIIYGNFFKLPRKLQKKYIPYLEEWFRKEYKKKLEKVK